MREISLPKLMKVKVTDYDLYKEDISFTIHKGINIIIGGNGLGKTTFLNLIIFGITGKRRVKPTLTPKYFMDRVKNKKDLFPKVVVEFSIRDTEFYVSRDIKTGEIDILRIDGKEITVENDDLEEFYNNNVIKYSNLDSFDDFCFILKNLLYAGEERNLILWDLVTHTKILGLLFIGKEYIKNYSSLLEDAKDKNKQWRHASYDNAQLRAELKEIEIKRQNALAREPTISKARDKIENIEDEIKEKREHLNRIMNLREENRNLMEKNNIEIDKISEKLENLDEELGTLELLVHQQIYPEKSPIYEEAKYQMENYGICIFCRSKNDKTREITKKREESKSCIICGNPLKISQEEPRTSYSGIPTKINELNNLKRILESKRKELNHGIEDMRKAIADAKEEENNLRRKIEILKLEKDELESRRAFLEIEPENATEYDLIIYNYRNLIEHRREIIAQKKEEWQKASEKFETEVGRMKSELERILDAFSKKFGNYASEFLAKSCTLEQMEKRMKTVGFEIPVFYPRFDEKTRDLKTSVSETQGLFLDHAYRFAIISLLFESSRCPVLYLAETPDAFSDIAYIKNIAKMFSNFCEEEHTVIITSNLSSKIFLSELLKNFEKNERRDRILNLLELGRLTTVQEKEKESFDEILEEVFGE